MPRRPPLRLLPAGAAALVLLLAGCSSGSAGPRPSRTPKPGPSPVAVPVPSSQDPEVVKVCSALLRAVPQELGDGLVRRAVTGDPLRTAAWGDPAVTLECGVPLPTRDEPPVQLGPNDGGPLVTFTTRDVGPATRFTTSGNAVNVAVTVPDQYDSQVLVQLTGALRALPTPSPAPGG